MLAASEQRDTETGSHIRRIGLYAAEIARLLDWNEEAVDCIRAAAPMHDIGKIGVPDRILQKPGALDEHEWALMTQVYAPNGTNSLANLILTKTLTGAGNISFWYQCTSYWSGFTFQIDSGIKKELKQKK